MLQCHAGWLAMLRIGMRQPSDGFAKQLVPIAMKFYELPFGEQDLKGTLKPTASLPEASQYVFADNRIAPIVSG
jgi:hypothetical protein